VAERTGIIRGGQRSLSARRLLPDERQTSFVTHEGSAVSPGSLSAFREPPRASRSVASAPREAPITIPWAPPGRLPGRQRDSGGSDSGRADDCELAAESHGTPSGGRARRRSRRPRAAPTPTVDAAPVSFPSELW